MSASTKPSGIGQTLRALAHLLEYPEQARRSVLPAAAEALRAEAALSESRQQQILDLIEALQSGDAFDVEATYVEVFDRGRSTSLHLFEHVHGDSRDRGSAMVDLIKTYEQQGLYLDDSELPDFLPVVLEFASTLPSKQAASFIGEFAHILNAIHTALVKRKAPYCCVLAGLIELAGETVELVQLKDEAPIDETWEEPEPFAGCSSGGQSRPDMPKPVQVIRRSTRTPIGEEK